MERNLEYLDKTRARERRKNGLRKRVTEQSPGQKHSEREFGEIEESGVEKH